MKTKTALKQELQPERPQARFSLRVCQNLNLVTPSRPRSHSSIIGRGRGGPRARSPMNHHYPTVITLHWQFAAQLGIFDHLAPSAFRFQGSHGPRLRGRLSNKLAFNQTALYCHQRGCIIHITSSWPRPRLGSGVGNMQT